MEEFSDGGSTPPASTKKDGCPVWGGRLFLCEGELKPKRAACGEENSPGDCFPARRCAGGYRNAKHLGRQALQTRSGCLPPPPPFILTSRGKLQEYASWSTFAGYEAYLFVIGTSGLKCKLLEFA